MTTTSHRISSEEMPAESVSQTANPPTWIILGQVFANWALLGTVIVSGIIGLESDFGVGRVLSGLMLAFLGFAFVSLGDGLVTLLWKVLGIVLPRIGLAGPANRLVAIPSAMIGRVLGVFLYIAGDMLWPDSFFQHINIPAVGEIFIVLLAVCGVLVALAHMEKRSRPGRFALFGVAGVVMVAYLAWVFLPGTDNYLPQVAAASPSVSLALPDPGLPGRFPVKTLTYGNGTSTRRPEFGENADLRTGTVDGSPIFAGYSGLGGSYYQWYWGFDFTHLPLNGLVWYPQGDGPFPIVLIAHGNHAMTEASDPGYAYLGEHLASHGYIAVSVDENFLNGMVFIDGQNEEIPLRAWMLLKHLQVWQEWNETPGTPFYEQVDLDHVALIGHSRGGEAVAAAASMNWYIPPPFSRFTSADEFGFGIDGVVAIAPSDDHYKPSGRSLTIPQSDYLLLGSGHDADTYVLYGQAQYNRVRFNENPDGFKALAYAYQGNHGQYNTVWANRDRGWLNSLLLNRRPLMSDEAQQQTARTFITAFLEASLRGQDGYRRLFANPTAGNDWLPEGITITQYEDASFIAAETGLANAAGNAEDGPTGETWVEDMTAFDTDEPLMLRDGRTSQQNRVTYLAWDAGSSPIMGIEPAEAVTAGQEDAFTFALASALEDDTPIAVTIELETAGGEVARLPLSQFGPVYPPLPAKLVKADWLASLPSYNMTVTTPFERVLQTYTLPLSDFQKVNPAFDPADIQAIRFLFDGSAASAVYLDQIGFIPSAP